MKLNNGMEVFLNPKGPGFIFLNGQKLVDPTGQYYVDPNGSLLDNQNNVIDQNGNIIATAQQAGYVPNNRDLIHPEILQQMSMQNNMGGGVNYGNNYNQNNNNQGMYNNQNSYANQNQYNNQNYSGGMFGSQTNNANIGYQTPSYNTGNDIDRSSRFHKTENEPSAVSNNFNHSGIISNDVVINQPVKEVIASKPHAYVDKYEPLVLPWYVVTKNNLNDKYFEYTIKKDTEINMNTNVHYSAYNSEEGATAKDVLKVDVIDGDEYAFGSDSEIKPSIISKILNNDADVMAIDFIEYDFFIMSNRNKNAKDFIKNIFNMDNAVIGSALARKLYTKYDEFVKAGDMVSAKAISDIDRVITAKLNVLIPVAACSIEIVNVDSYMEDYNEVINIIQNDIDDPKEKSRLEGAINTFNNYLINIKTLCTEHDKTLNDLVEDLAGEEYATTSLPYDCKYIAVKNNNIMVELVNADDDIKIVTEELVPYLHEAIHKVINVNPMDNHKNTKIIDVCGNTYNVCKIIGQNAYAIKKIKGK